jgi:predicted MPP superfamily phosphohydrolase
LLDHQPRGIERWHSGRLPDCALSGHTHAGQFFPGTVVINWVWKVAYGTGALGGVYWLVSSGFDCWGPPVRFGSDSEIWVIKFKAREP